MKIQFTDFGVDDSSTLGMTALDESKESNLTFQLPERFVPANDLIGLAISTMVGTKYDQIDIDLPLTARTQAAIESLTKASVNSPLQALPQSASPGKSMVLNFSGGFDSLATLALLPDDTKLVSLDFGGNFQREAEFFKTFDTTSVATNFRSQGFAGNAWQFMGIGTLLLRDYLEIQTYSFGSILEASPWNFKQQKYSNAPQPVFKAAGMTQLNPAIGLTEIGTVMLIVKHFPDRIAESLKSLAAPGSEKLNRKIMLLNIALELTGSSLGLDIQPDRVTPHFGFGSSLATDFLSLYIMKKRGAEQAGQLVENIPQVAADFVCNRSLTFFERLNTIFADGLPQEDRSRLYINCIEAGILPYSETDWTEYRETIAFLSQWHKALK